ncbi:unnamed protein product [Gongylonema pulchrum]|uniref:Uncharacterized protein n=1 Tax=Gongylonema pulchrum TaxID=637853 RepID=A0A183ES74_9BILA|nr:unnamed protein product [Gongylonema pulchrum]
MEFKCIDELANNDYRRNDYHFNETCLITISTAVVSGAGVECGNSGTGLVTLKTVTVNLVAGSVESEAELVNFEAGPVKLEMGTGSVTGSSAALLFFLGYAAPVLNGEICPPCGTPCENNAGCGTITPGCVYTGWPPALTPTGAAACAGGVLLGPHAVLILAATARKTTVLSILPVPLFT